MDENRIPCDVFISCAAADTDRAAEVARAFVGSGLNAVTMNDLSVGQNLSDLLWDALAECRAMIVIFSSATPNPTMTFEIGAAKAWNKPIFALVTNPAIAPLPAGFSDLRLYPIERVDDVVRAVKETALELTEQDRTALADAYSDIGVSVDRLATETGQLGRLVKRFNSKSRKTVSGDQLLSELLRMRKQGLLAKGRNGQGSRLRKTPA
jgi:hypothetical protein